MSDKEITFQEKLEALRAEMKVQGLDGFIVPLADEYQGEFPAGYAQRLSWLSGFTGSAGVAIILKDKAVVLTDGRYIIQVAQQVDGDLYETGDSTKISIGEWLADNAEGCVVGYDPWLHTPEQLEKIKEDFEEELQSVSKNLVDQIWNDQPELPKGRVDTFPETVAGLTSAQKRMQVAEELSKGELGAAFITLPDSICWLLNVRGSDIDYIPLVLSTVMIDGEGVVVWFVDADKISDDVRKHIGNIVKIMPPDSISEYIGRLVGAKVGLDFRSAPSWFEAKLKEVGAEIVDFKDPCIDLKAIKTTEEQQAIKETHIRDGVVLARFLAWLDQEAPKGELTELSVTEKLREFRLQEELCRGLSFPSIVGFGENGAIIHYRATPETNLKIEPPGLLLIDSGSQYHYGTTDITRTVAVGEPTQEMKENFTRVLQGHIALARTYFPEGTTGVEIDALARQPLKDVGLNYAHGTGHGVGCFLQVHEESAAISPRGERSKLPVKEGMFLSNEPGYYKEGAYGIRIENLVLVKNASEGQLCFETVSLAPIDRRLIVKEMLSTEDLDWLNEYHARVRDTLTPRLEENHVRDWLEVQTEPL